MASIARLIVSVANLDAALAFYAGVLGLREERRQGDFAFLRTEDGVELLLHQRPSVPSRAAVAIGFSVADVVHATDGCVRAGGTVIDPPQRQPWGELMSVVTDPDGHVVCLSQR